MLTKAQALTWIIERTPLQVASYGELGRAWGWRRPDAWKAIDRWRKRGYVETESGNGSITVAALVGSVPVDVPDTVPGDMERVPERSETHMERAERGVPGRGETLMERSEMSMGTPYGTLDGTQPKRSFTQWLFGGPPAPAARTQPGPTVAYGRVVGGTGGAGLDNKGTWKHATADEKFLIVIALGLSLIAAFISVAGLRTLFPYDELLVTLLGWCMEAAKFWGVAVLSAGWKRYSFFGRILLSFLILNVACLNAASVYARLSEGHFGPAATRAAQYNEQEGDRAAKAEVATSKIADDERRLQVLDRVQRPNRQQQQEHSELLDDLDAQRATLSKLKSAKSSANARRAEDEAKAMPARYTTQFLIDLHLIDPDASPDSVIRIMAFCILMAGDPLALVILWTINSRRRKRDRGGFYRRV